MKIRCTETGRGTAGSTFVCDLPQGEQIVLKAIKTAIPQMYAVYSELPRMRYMTILYGSRRGGDLKRKIEEWLNSTLSTG